MASKTQKTKEIRRRKHLANKENLKKNQKRVIRNLEVMAKVAEAQ